MFALNNGGKPFHQSSNVSWKCKNGVALKKLVVSVDADLAIVDCPHEDVVNVVVATTLLHFVTNNEDDS